MRIKEAEKRQMHIESDSRKARLQLSTSLSNCPATVPNNTTSLDTGSPSARCDSWLAQAWVDAEPLPLTNLHTYVHTYVEEGLGNNSSPKTVERRR